jgi:glutamate-ammonia-ligase adenylyltransferase
MNMPTALSITELPKASNLQEIDEIMQLLREHTGRALTEKETALLHASAGNAPYLARLIRRHPDCFIDASAGNSMQDFAATQATLNALPLTEMSQATLMAALRHAKEQTALRAALLEIAHDDAVMDAANALSHFAEHAVSCTLRWLLLRAAKNGDIRLKHHENPEQQSGVVILGMGKLGGLELNYSSDIDLIILFDPETLHYTGHKNAQYFMNRLVQDMIHILQERTQEGYVFRTDIRLRPDPASTPPAVRLPAALTYYETLGQNWERAAMIKARPIAGDLATGWAFLEALIPYIWRKNLDYAALEDIYSIKRQMHSGTTGALDLEGHNIKTGIGGIREIEFYVQTQQLVWGGRVPELRVRSTLNALDMLCTHRLIDEHTRDSLQHHYRHLRTVEHRLQMTEDQQTHRMPEHHDAMVQLACFLGESISDFRAKITHTLEDVHRIYTLSMKDSTPLGHQGKLVFTGVDPDPDTLRTLAHMGFEATERIWHIIQLWHRGSRRATKTTRARSELTEITPMILRTLADTSTPDKAFTQFDDFISKLPSGVQIFSLLRAHPYLMQLIADVLGSAPALGATLGSNPLLLDAVLDQDFFAPLPDYATLHAQLEQRISAQADMEKAMVLLRVFHNEKRFQAGLHMLKHLATPSQVSLFLTSLAEVVIAYVMQRVGSDYGHGAASCPMAVLALGKLGAREMTFNSDIDIIFLYDDGAQEDTELPTHMHRISQRIIHSLSLMMREGRLYEVDTRLRPGGIDGPIATSLAAFDAYFTHSAWTFELMALTKARVIACNDTTFAQRIGNTLRAHVTKPRNAETVRHDAADMRQRMRAQFGSTNPYHVKHVDGGLTDIDFFAQTLVLQHAATYPNLYQHNTTRMLEEAQKAGLLNTETASALQESAAFLHDALCIQRLCVPKGMLTDASPASHVRTVAKAMGLEHPDDLVTKLRWHQARVCSMIGAV